MIELKYVTATPDNTGTLLSWNIPRQVSFCGASLLNFSAQS